MTLSLDIARARDIYDDWINGRRQFTVREALQLKRDLDVLVVKAAMAELGVDLTVVDVAEELSRPGTNLLVFSPRKPNSGSAA